MTTSSISVSSSKNNLVLYHQQTINGPSMQDRHLTQSVTSKTYKMKGNENEIYKSSAIPNGSPSNSPTVNNRNHISNPTNPLGTPTFRRSSTGGDRNRGSMRKMLPALPDMDTQVICTIMINISNFHISISYLSNLFTLSFPLSYILDVSVCKNDRSTYIHTSGKSFIRTLLFRVFFVS